LAAVREYVRKWHNDTGLYFIWIHQKVACQVAPHPEGQDTGSLLVNPTHVAWLRSKCEVAIDEE
jgi:hypothetical protein